MKIKSISYLVVVTVFVFLTACSQVLSEPYPTVSSPRPMGTPQSYPSVDTALTDKTKTPIEVTPKPDTSPSDMDIISTYVTGVKPEINNSLLLYTTTGPMIESSTFSVSSEYWPLRTWPSIPYFELPVFETFYKVTKGMSDDVSRYLSDLRPQLSPNGRYILLPGSDTNPNSDWGRGLLLVDLQAEMPEDAVRQLLPKTRIATWSPDNDAIAYVDGNTLYTLVIGEDAMPTPLFSHPSIWALYAKWSPDGRWIATVTTTQQAPDAEGSPELTNTYWLVPTNGEPARELTTQMDFAMKYTANEMAWSPDSQLLLMRNEIFDLEGNLVSPDYPGRASWHPNQAQLLVNGQSGLHLMTVSGEIITTISSAFADTWAFSHDGQKLAYSQSEDVNVNLFIFDLNEPESQLIGSVPLDYVSKICWSGDDMVLIFSGKQGSNDQIWTLASQPGSPAEHLLDKAILIEVVTYPTK